MTPRRLLVLSYFHPPFPQSGGSRWLSMARHLRALGHEVTIVTTTAHGTLPEDEEQGVVRAADLAAAGSLRRLLRRPALTGDGATQAAPAPALLTKLVVPDSHLVSWAPAAWRAARALLRAGRYDCLVTSGPPDSTHLVGLALGRARPAWIADFRDGWVFQPPREPFPTAPQRALDRELERRVARAADAVVAATRPIAEDFERRLGVRAAWVPNGWDPALEPAADAGLDLPGGPGTLVHTGTLSGAWGRDPRPLLTALARVVRDGVALRLVLAGRAEPAVERLVARLGLETAVEHVGLVDRPTALALQRRAGTLLLLTSPNASEATGKLFEYLAAGRPILALAGGTEAGRIVAETHTGDVVASDDIAAIAAALRRAAVGRIAYEPAGLERFSYPGPAEVLAALAEEAVERRATR